MALWHLFPKTLTSLRLWRTGNNSFRIVEYGEPTDVLTNYDYLLFDKKYGETLLKPGKQISISPATVQDKVRNIIWENYLEVTIREAIPGDSLAVVPANGLRIYSFDRQYIFVSEELKNEFEKVAGQKLGFTLGLSFFTS